MANKVKVTTKTIAGDYVTREVDAKAHLIWSLIIFIIDILLIPVKVVLDDILSPSKK